MRVIAGSAKGVRLGAVPAGVRPVSDRAREGMFSSLGDAVSGAGVLDLFAGTGALAIEALSRGAGSAVLVERDRGAAAAIRANLERTGFSEQARLAVSTVEGFLGAGVPGRAFDLVFMDPPYDLGSPGLEEVFRRLAGASCLAGGFSVILTRGQHSDAPVLPLDWAAARRLQYGDTLVTIVREV